MFEIIINSLSVSGLSKVILTVIAIVVIVLIAIGNISSDCKAENVTIAMPSICIIALFVFRKFVELCIACVRLDNIGWEICLGIVALIMLLWFMLKHLSIFGALLWGAITTAVVLNYGRVSSFLPPIILAFIIIAIKDELELGLIRTMLYIVIAGAIVMTTGNITLAFELTMLIDLGYRSIVNVRIGYGIVTLIGTTCCMFLGYEYLHSWVFFIPAYALYKFYTG